MSRLIIALLLMSHGILGCVAATTVPNTTRQVMNETFEEKSEPSKEVFTRLEITDDELQVHVVRQDMCSRRKVSMVREHTSYSMETSNLLSHTVVALALGGTSGLLFRIAPNLSDEPTVNKETGKKEASPRFTVNLFAVGAGIAAVASAIYGYSVLDKAWPPSDEEKDVLRPGEWTTETCNRRPVGKGVTVKLALSGSLGPNGWRTSLTDESGVAHFGIDVVRIWLTDGIPAPDLGQKCRHISGRAVLDSYLVAVGDPYVYKPKAQAFPQEFMEKFREIRDDEILTAGTQYVEKVKDEVTKGDIDQARSGLECIQVALQTYDIATKTYTPSVASQSARNDLEMKLTGLTGAVEKLEAKAERERLAAEERAQADEDRKRRRAEALGEDCSFSGENVECELKMCMRIVVAVRKMRPDSSCFAGEPIDTYRSQWGLAMRTIDNHLTFLRQTGNRAQFFSIQQRAQRCMQTPRWFTSCSN